VGNHNSGSNNKLLQKTTSQKLVNKIGKNRLWHAPMGKGTLGGILHGGQTSTLGHDERLAHSRYSQP